MRTAVLVALLSLLLPAPGLHAGKPWACWPWSPPGGCPDDYCRKPCPGVCSPCRPACGEPYCRKPCPPLCLLPPYCGVDDYCRKPCPRVCPPCWLPWYSCGSPPAAHTAATEALPAGQEMHTARKPAAPAASPDPAPKPTAGKPSPGRPLPHHTGPPVRWTFRPAGPGPRR